MARLSCAQARDLACDLLDGELDQRLRRSVERHVASCPTCPKLYQALVAVHRGLGRMREAAETTSELGGGC